MSKNTAGKFTQFVQMTSRVVEALTYDPAKEHRREQEAIYIPPEEEEEDALYQLLREKKTRPSTTFNPLTAETTPSFSDIVPNSPSRATGLQAVGREVIKPR